MSKPLRVLVVDDDEGFLEIASGLRRHSHELIVARDGLEALDMAKRHPPDVMVIYVMLPGVNGYELSRMLKEWAEGREDRHFPIILMTNRMHTSPERQHFVESWSQADVFCRRPKTVEQILSYIKQAMSK